MNLSEAPSVVRRITLSLEGSWKMAEISVKVQNTAKPCIFVTEKTVNQTLK